MTVWINHYSRYETNIKGENRLVVGFYRLPKEGKEPRKVKIFLRKKVTIPSDLIHKSNVDEVVKEVGRANIISVGDFRVLEVEREKISGLKRRMPREFQTESYDKLLRFRGFYPERLFSLSPETERLFNSEDVLELDKLEGIKPVGFLEEEGFRRLPWLYLDIEKPLFKKDDEKRLIKGRKKILRLEKRDQKRSLEERDGKQGYRMSALKGLEDKLTLDVPGIGKVRLWEEKYDARITQIATTWKNCFDEGVKRDEIRELYCIDEEGLIDIDEINGYKIKRYKSEVELLSGFIDAIHKRKPLNASGHNQVYDHTQIRFAADEHGLMFDPGVKDIRSRRDFVRYMCQRMREDMFYFDTLNLNGFLSPFLRQKRFSNLTLKETAKYHGLNFKKSMTHDELRFCELERLDGGSVEIRRAAALKMADYASNDVEPVVRMIEDSPFISLVLQLKKIMPYCTYTEIAAFPNFAQMYHEYKHFKRARNLRLRGYKRKQYEDEKQIFKKRFPKLKEEMLDWAGIPRKRVLGDYKDVFELYLPFEEWIKEETFTFAPEFKEGYFKIPKEAKIGYLRAMDAVDTDMLRDYYFARREAKVVREYDNPINRSRPHILKLFVGQDLIDRYTGSFRFLKNHFRSVYVALKGKGRAMIRPTKKNLEGIVIPEEMKAEADLFLLRERTEEVRGELKPKSRHLLNTFLTNFATLEGIEEKIIEDAKKNGINVNKGQLYILNQLYEKEKREKAFYARYGLGVEQVTRKIASSYRRLKEELDRYGAKVLEQKGDYLFVQADSEIENSKLVYVVRKLPVYEVENRKKTD